MPCLRGLEISLITKPDDESIPEYPHPEGSSARLIGLATTLKEGSYGHDRKIQPICPSQYHKNSPTVSVYIPSIPGSRFAVTYTVNTIPPGPCRFMFFRLYINSRPIAAWGVEVVARTRGQVVKSLWAPGDEYIDQVGYEGRNFVFLPGEEKKPVAEEGGLIEIHAFRAKDRRSRSAKLEEFRYYQENYSIAAPSVGLVDQPQDASFYDWHLLDAKDCPFTCFRFHYRSFKNLKDLNLIPLSELAFIQSRSPKPPRRPTLASIDTELCGSVEGLSCISENSPLDEGVFVDCKGQYETPNSNSTGSHYLLKSPPERFAVSATRSTMPQPSKMLRDAFRESYLQRPLPELPIHEPITASRRSSAVSAAPSITPSLRQYIDEDSFAIEDAEMGTARAVQLLAAELSIVNLQDDDGDFHDGIPADYSISNYELSPQSTNDSNSEKMLSPKTYLPMTGNKFERGLSMFTSPKRSKEPPAIPPKAEARRHVKKSQGFHPELRQRVNPGYDLSRAESMAITESQWMSRSPSPPARLRSEDNGVGRPGTPHPEGDELAGRSIFSGLLRRKRSRSPSKLTGLIPRRLSPNKPERPHDDTIPASGRVGNWI
ncbi:hypothetical protein QBC38DRAFT_280737 [Podospora fimiseda]|uniref:Uncharacterized protein n=1 Tax=Podospora fimiseda TaxID=252190 RepID=A0AAN7BKL5_9PEZI|nr:hypothetical protein QBC38DRAFT_280737 [Podospora fimiseda]